MAGDQTIFVVDDDEAVRQSVRYLLESIRLEVREFESGDRFLDAVDAGEIGSGGCVLLDVRMPGKSGLELQSVLGQRAFWLPIILVTGHGDVPMAVRAMTAGAFSFVEKPYKDQELLDLVMAALEHEKSNRADKLARREAVERTGSLTPREKEVFTLVVKGMANKQIAAALGVSEKTVETHRSNVMQKMGAESLAHLVRISLAAE